MTVDAARIVRVLDVAVSVYPSVTSQCSTEMAKGRITQSVPHDSPVTHFLMPKISAKLKRGHLQWRRQMQVGVG